MPPTLRTASDAAPRSTSPERKTIAEQWEIWRAAVMPPDVHEVQLTEMRRAFYAGATVLLSALTIGLDEDSEPTADDVAYLERLHQEMKQFSRDVGEGRA